MFDTLFALCLTGVAPALPQDWWLQWSLAPPAVVALLALAWLGRGASPAQRPWLAGGLLLCALAWLSPLCRLGATLAAGHMAQLMVVVAAGALLAVGLPRARPVRALPAWTALHALVLWAWHWPAAYAAILGDPFVHTLAWGALLASACRFWQAVGDALARRPLPALVALLATMGHTGLLGALLTLAGSAWYPAQAPGALAWGLDPLADQQVAGLLMWVVGGGAYLALVVGLAVRRLAGLAPAGGAAPS